VMPVWGGRPRPPTCALQFVIRPNGTAEKPALIRTSAFDPEVHCGADNEAAQKGAEYYSPGRKSWVSLRTSESRRDGRNETGRRTWEGHGFSRAAKVLQSCHSEPSATALALRELALSEAKGHARNLLLVRRFTYEPIFLHRRFVSEHGFSRAAK